MRKDVKNRHFRTGIKMKLNFLGTIYLFHFIYSFWRLCYIIVEKFYCRCSKIFSFDSHQRWHGPTWLGSNEVQALKLGPSCYLTSLPWELTHIIWSIYISAFFNDSTRNKRRIKKATSSTFGLSMKFLKIALLSIR